MYNWTAVRALPSPVDIVLLWMILQTNISHHQSQVDPLPVESCQITDWFLLFTSLLVILTWRGDTSSSMMHSDTEVVEERSLRVITNRASLRHPNMLSPLYCQSQAGCQVVDDLSASQDRQELTGNCHASSLNLSYLHLLFIVKFVRLLPFFVSLDYLLRLSD